MPQAVAAYIKTNNFTAVDLARDCREMLNFFLTN